MSPRRPAAKIVEIVRAGPRASHRCRRRSRRHAQPTRLDLDDVAAREARSRGVRLVIATDVYDTTELGFIRWGVDQARRAWAERADVANTRALDGLLKLLHRSR